VVSTHPARRPPTRETRIQNRYKKIGATSRTAAAMYALERGIFTD